MAKITSLTEDSGIGLYYDKAVSKCDEGDYIGCLDLLFTARKLLNAPYSDDDLSLLLEIGDTYSEMGLLDESNKYYFKMMPYSYCLDDAYYSLVRNFIFMGESRLAMYYLNMGLDLGILDPGDGFSPEEIEELANPERESLHDVNDADTEYLMTIARQLMNSHDTEFARQMLDNISPDNRHYADASNYLAIIEISDGNHEKGIEYCDGVLERDPDNVTAITVKIIGLHLQGRNEEVGKLVERLSEIDFDDAERLNKVVMCMAEIGNDELTAKYSEQLLAKEPYDRNAMLLAALSRFNLGDRARAKELIVSLCTIYRDDYTVKYYARLIDGKGGKKSLPLLVFIDPEERAARISAINEALTRSVGPAEFVEEFLRDEELNDAVMWGLTEGDDETACKIGAAVAQAKNGGFLTRSLLLDPDCSVVLKKTLLFDLFKSGNAHFLQAVIGDQLQWFRPVIPKITRRAEFTEAYWKVYVALAFIEAEYDRKLNAWYRKVVGALAIKEYGFDSSALAALIAYKAQIGKIFSTEEYCCEIFDCNRDDFVLYSDMFEAATVERRVIRKRTTGTAQRRPHAGRNRRGGRKEDV